MSATDRSRRVEELARELYKDIVVCEGPPEDAVSGRWLAEECFTVAEWFEVVAEVERSVAETTPK